jgi:1,4-dihydroxy-2-naphthoyl-CoA hydrolase
MSALFDAVVRRAAGTMLETIGLRLIEINEEHAVAEMTFRPGLDQFTGVFHTGALLTLADSTATSACLHATDPEGTLDPARFPLAVQLSANLIRNTGSGSVTAESRLVHRGRTTMVAETSVRDEQGRLLLLLTSTHLILAR